MADLILDVDYNVTQAEAKQRKLDREFQLSQQKAENIKKQMAGTAENIQKSTEKIKILKSELEDLSKKNREKLLSNTQTSADTEAYKKKKAEIEKENQLLAKQNILYKKQEVSLNKQNSRTADIGDKILLNSKKQIKFTQAFSKSTKSADRFGRRLKSLIASALFFSVVTKAFTALRNEFGKLITETGTKTATLVKQLNGCLSVLGRTLYETARPAIEWILQKLIQIVNILTYGLAKILGKNVDEMKKLAKQTKKAGEEAQKTTAGFDTLQTIGSSSNSSNSENADFSKIKEPTDDALENFKDILNICGSIGLAIAGWKVGDFFELLGFSKIANVVSGLSLIVAGISLLIQATSNWNDELGNGENTLNTILGTIGTILAAVGLIILGVAAWPVAIAAVLIIIGMWIDNYKKKVDKWLDSLPAGIYDIMHLLIETALSAWYTFKEILRGVKEIFAGDWEKGLKRIGIAVVNSLIYMLNTLIDATNLILYPFRAIIAGIGKLTGKDITIRDVAIPHIKTIEVPKLATGAILPGGSPMLAWVNDQPKGQPYVEGSIENIAAAFEKYLGNKSIDNPNFTVRATGSLAPLIRLLNLEIQKENKRNTVWG